MTQPETPPLVAHAADPTPAAGGRAKALLQRHTPRRLPAGSQGRLRLSQGEADLILAALPQALPGLRARVNSIGNTAKKQPRCPTPLPQCVGFLQPIPSRSSLRKPLGASGQVGYQY